MGVIISGIVAAVVIAVGAGFVLTAARQPVYQSQPMPTVRVGDPGTNLVGQDWSGNTGKGDRAKEARAGGRQQ